MAPKRKRAPRKKSSKKKKKEDRSEETVGPSATPVASTSTVEPPRTEAQTSTEEPGEGSRMEELKDLSPVRMQEHALAILEQKDRLNWPDTSRTRESSSKFQAITPTFLYYLIVESQKFRGGVLAQFWKILGTCDEKLKENIESLGEEDFVSADRSYEVLFRGLDPKNVDFEPVLEMAREFFNNVGVALMNPGGQKIRTGTVFSVSEIVNEETNNLLEQVNKKGDFGKRKQTALKELAFRRDGDICLLTGLQLEHLTTLGYASELVHIIPNSVHGQSPTLKCIGMFAGLAATEEITGHLNKPNNVMNMELHAHVAYDNMRWGIEARVDGQEVKYFIRMVPADFNIRDVSPITLEDGDEIRFGTGPKPEGIHRPIPILCNLQLAVARVMRMSGAADIILEWKNRADDEFEGWDGFFIASEESCRTLDAKLFLTGRAVVA